MSTNSATKSIVDYLNMNKCKVWRSNNVGIYDAKKDIYRKNPNQLLGISDIIGITKDGFFLGIEIKTGKDKLKPEQKVFIEEITKRKGIILVVKSFDDFLVQWGNLNKKPL
jgi:hypothetical protein